MSSRRRATSSVNSRLFRLTRLYMMIAQKFTAPKMARTLRDICSDREACPVQKCIVRAARGPGERGHGWSEVLPTWSLRSRRVPGQLSVIVNGGETGLERGQCLTNVARPGCATPHRWYGGPNTHRVGRCPDNQEGGGEKVLDWGPSVAGSLQRATVPSPALLTSIRARGSHSASFCTQSSKLRPKQLRIDHR